MTITPDKIMAALHQRLEETFPGEPVYEHLTPRDFQRPCNLLELVRTDLEPQSMGMAAVTLRYQFRITTFAQTDEVHDSHLPVLDLRAMMVLGAFGSGFLRVEDRALKAASCWADSSMYDAAEVHLTLTLTVDRAEFRPEDLLPVMQELSTRYISKEDAET